jgi:hypothetical protein
VNTSAEGECLSKNDILPLSVFRTGINLLEFVKNCNGFLVLARFGAALRCFAQGPDFKKRGRKTLNKREVSSLKTTTESQKDKSGTVRRNEQKITKLRNRRTQFPGL